jgi:hypothetical protein
LEVPYYQAARFPNKSTAGAVYSVVQDILYKNVDCDLSVYRLKQGRTFIVVVLGEKPSDSLHIALEALLTNGVLVSLSEDQLHYLQVRRAEAVQIAPWVEGHYTEEGEA